MTVDINKKVKGLYFNTDENVCSFILSDDSAQRFAGGDSGIEMKDLAAALYVFCNEDVQCKNLSFSLDPVDERNPEGDF